MIPSTDWKWTYRSPKKTNMTMKHPPFEDVFPIEHGDFPMSVFRGVSVNYPLKYQ